MPLAGISITVNPRDIARIEKRLSKWQGKPLALRMEKALQAGMKLYVPALKAVTPRSDHGSKGRWPHPPGNMQRKTGIKKLRKRPGEVAAYYAGPKTFYGQWVQHGHRIVRGGHAKGNIVTGRIVGHAAANPYVEGVRRQLEPTVTAFISEQIRRLA